MIYCNITIQKKFKVNINSYFFVKPVYKVVKMQYKVEVF